QWRVLGYRIRACSSGSGLLGSHRYLVCGAGNLLHRSACACGGAAADTGRLMKQLFTRHFEKLQYRIIGLLTILLLIASASPAAVQVDALRKHITWLADPAREGRRAGLQGAVDSAQYIAAQFRQSGFDVRMQEFGANRRNVVARRGTA